MKKRLFYIYFILKKLLSIWNGTHRSNPKIEMTGLPMSTFFQTSFGSAEPEATRTTDFDFEIMGHEMQYVLINLAPGMSAIAEAGAMIFKDAAIQMETVFGDASSPSDSLWEKIANAGKRILGGATVFSTVFTNADPVHVSRVAFTAPVPGKIIPLRLADFGGTIICHKESFLCAQRGAHISIAFRQNILTGFFGGEGFILQKIDGSEWAFIHSGGNIYERDLEENEEIHVHPGSIAAFTQSIHFDVTPVSGIKSKFFGGQGFFFARLTGPGRVWLQSLPFSRMVAAMSTGVTAGVAVSGTTFENDKPTDNNTMPLSDNDSSDWR
ncbi:Hypothetical protein GbCGDNIH9_8598 [Granulibacter bethesdensis]|uniref:Uncharacterized protein n=1 Tax=Granulibacter bethesdensis TaxID=364410 RepID=A0AAC9KD87_9PROT|nr:AIM24 family protein [Granulibacter bethesdensis]APH54892.1 Hypothetical protein GbCGDNIH9_8598 [Granulibacter bethesdensis]APH62478.1 Hypothetical protein GbCGDNIH8_8598 [Granulibacter bethesdensis]